MSEVYEKAGEAFLTRKMDWVEDEARLLLVTKDYRCDAKRHEFLSDIPQVARVAISNPLPGKIAKGFTCTAGTALIERIIGPDCNAVVLFHCGKNESTSRLIAYIDEATFLPHKPNGGDLEVAWDERGIFNL